MKFGKAVARSWSVASMSRVPATFPFTFDQYIRKEDSKVQDFKKETNNKLSFTSKPISQVQLSAEPIQLPSELSQDDARNLLCRLREEALSSIVLDGVGPISVKKVDDYSEMERMGSFTSAPVKASGDVQDADVEFSNITSLTDLLDRCRHHTVHLPPPINREYTQYDTSFQHTPDTSDVKVDEKNKIRILQWNHLSQTLGTKNDNFVVCPPEALDWSSRRWRLLEEIIRYQPDVICLQEVDHFDFLNRGLKTIGYSGKFIPKPDSPCIYLQGNNGPDGCAIFVKDSKFKILSDSHRILEVWRVQSNQVAVCLELLDVETNQELVVATTHLKARQGALLSTLRNEQGKDLLDWLHTTAGGRPVLLSGDFNAPESEPIYTSVCEHDIGLASTYRFKDLGMEEPYTTWKIRETGEQKYVLDYIFHSKSGLKPVGVLEMPKDHEVGENKFPSPAFPSDHLSLVADFQYV